MTSGILRSLREIFDRRTKLRLLAAALGVSVAALLDMLAVALVLPLVDLATNPNTDSRVVATVRDALGNPTSGRLQIILTVAVVGLFVVKDLAQLAFGWWLNGFVFRQRVHTTALILRHYLTSPWTSMAGRSSAEMIRTADGAVMNVFNLTVNGLLTAFSASVSIVAIVAALLLLAPVPTLALMAYFALAGVIQVQVVKPRAVRAGQVLTESSRDGYHAFLTALGGLKDIILRGNHRHFTERYERASLRGAEANRRSAFYGMLPRYVLEIQFILAVGLVLALGNHNGGGPVATLAVFVAAAFRVIPSLSSLMGSLATVRVGSASLTLVLDEVRQARVNARRGQADDTEATVGPISFSKAVTVEHVSFVYPSSESPVLRDVSLTIPFGQSVALVGGSGAGKTTLADLILGLHHPVSGRVAVDGVDIEEIRRSWKVSVAHVPQEVFLLDATIGENIAFDLDPSSVDPERVAEAVDQAQLRDLIADLEDGLATRVGERGSLLSGGQRQRIGIARALYQRPNLLVLDEATSALDNETESLITRTLRALHGQITLVIVAHRLSTVRDADCVVFLKGGRVEASGTFEEVRAASQDFERLVQLGSLETPAEVPPA